MRFKRVYLEISNRCNLSCSFCSPLKRPFASMDLEQFTHIVREIRPFTDYVYFHVKGEPLMHPLLGDFLDVCAEAGLRVNLTTNGTLLAQTRALLLSKPALRQVNISLHSFSAHDSRIDPERYLEEAVDFARAASREHGIYTVLRLWNLDEHREADSSTDQMIREIGRVFHSPIDLIQEMKHNRSVCLEPRAFISWEQEFDWPHLASPYVSDSGICYGMRAMAGILADGTVVPCCLDADGVIALGNVFDEPFSQIISSRRARYMADSFTNRRVTEPLCRHCSYRTRFDREKQNG